MKYIFITIGGVVGWLVAELRPTFPLIIVAVAFILYDAFTAYQLDRRVNVHTPTGRQGTRRRKQNAER